MTQVNLFAPLSCKLEGVIDETPTIKTFVLVPEEPISFRAGQFVQVTVPGLGEAPFTPSSSPYVKDKLEVTVLRTGRVTDAMHELSAGVELGVRGPFGKGYPVEEAEGKEVLIVGGGVGLAPLRSLIYALLENTDRYKRISIRYGARSPDELLYQREYESWGAKDKVDFTPTIDRPAKGWSGHVGLVTSLLEQVSDEMDVPNAIAVCCGPTIMLRFVTFALLDKGFDAAQIYLSLNRRMSCGMGICGRCNIGPYYVCKDGPDMRYDKIKDYPNVF